MSNDERRPLTAEDRECIHRKQRFTPAHELRREKIRQAARIK